MIHMQARQAEASGGKRTTVWSFGTASVLQESMGHDSYPSGSLYHKWNVDCLAHATPSVQGYSPHSRWCPYETPPVWMDWIKWALSSTEAKIVGQAKWRCCGVGANHETCCCMARLSLSVHAFGGLGLQVCL